MKHIGILALLICVPSLTGLGDDGIAKKSQTQDDFLFKKIGENQVRVAGLIEKIPAAKVKLFFYSIDPNTPRDSKNKLTEPPKELFHEYPVLGFAEIVSMQDKTNLLGTFAAGILENKTSSAWCFEPRHGIRIVSENATNDFVICFECLQVYPYGFDSGHRFLTSGSPAAVFNSVLEKHHIKKAKERSQPRSNF